MDEDNDDKRHGGNVAVLAVAAIIIVLAVLLLHVMADNLKTERCLEERRHGCGDSTEQSP